MNKYTFEICCILPLALFLICFTLFPVLEVFYISFQGKEGLTWNHYITLFQDPTFTKAFWNTLIIACGSLLLEVSLGLFIALLLTSYPKYLKWIRPLFILPLAIPTVVVAVMMSFLFSTSGWINRFLLDTDLINSPIFWIEGGYKSLFMLILADSWKVTPLVMLIMMAGLESIDTQLYKAARIDGASSFYVFRRITLPLLVPSITTAVIIRGIDAFRIFAMPLILMGQSLKVVGTYSYLEFMDYNNQYLSAASAVVLFCMIVISLLFFLRLVGKRGLQV